MTEGFVQAEVLRKELQTALHQIEQHKVDKQSLELNIHQLIRSLEQKEALLETERKRLSLLERSKTDLASEKSEFVVERRKLLDQLESLKSEHDGLLERYTKLQGEVQQQQLDTLSKNKHGVEEGNNHDLVLLKEKEELKVFLASALQSINELKTEIANQTISFQRVEEQTRTTFEHNLKTLTTKSDHLEQEVIQLKAENSALTQQKVDLEAFLQNTSEKQLILEVSKLNEMLRQKTEQLALVQTELNERRVNVSEEHGHLKTRMARLDEEVTFLRNASEQYENALSKSNAFAKEHEQMIERLTKQNRNLVEKLKEAEIAEFKSAELAKDTKGYDELAVKMKEQEKANKILQRAVIERSNLLSHILVHLHERLYPEQPFVSPFFCSDVLLVQMG